MKIYIVEKKDKTYILTEQGEVLAINENCEENFTKNDLYDIRKMKKEMFHKYRKLEIMFHKYAKLQIINLGDDDMTEEELKIRNLKFYHGEVNDK